MGFIRRLINSANPHRWKQQRHFHDLRKWQWLGPEDHADLQRQRLIELLTHAYNHVPYYREVFGQCGVVNDAGEVDIEKFTSIPFLTKPILHDHFEDLKSDDMANRSWFVNTSGGSTGETAAIVQDRFLLNWRFAAKALLDEWTGCRLGDPQLRIWGSVRDTMEGHVTPKVRFWRYLRNEMWISAFEMGPQLMLECVDLINRSRPRQILAYSTSLIDLAEFVEREKLKVRPPGAIMTTASTLTPEMRETIQRAFRSPIFDRYGSREVGDMACECEAHKGLHVISPMHYLEIVRPDGSPVEPLEVGEIGAPCPPQPRQDASHPAHILQKLAKAGLSPSVEANAQLLKLFFLLAWCC